MQNDFFIGDRFFKSQRQGSKLPQGGNSQEFYSNYYSTGSPAASLTYSVNLISASPTQTIYLKGIVFSTYCLTVAGALKDIDLVRVGVFGAAIDLLIPYPSGMVPATSAKVYTVSGNPQNKDITMMFPDGVKVQPNQELTIQANYQQKLAFVATDNIVAYCQMIWSM